MFANSPYFGFLYLVIFTCGMGCMQGRNPSYFRTDTLIHEPGLQLVAVYLDSVFYRFEYVSGAVNGRTRPMELLPPGVPRVNWYDKEYVYLTVSCGTSCRLGYVLPLNGRDTIKEYFQPLHTDKDKHLIFYSEDGTLFMENFRNGRRLTHKHNLLTPHDRYFIDSLRAVGNKAYVYYSIPDNPLKLETLDITILTTAP